MALETAASGQGEPFRSVRKALILNFVTGIETVDDEAVPA